MSTLGAENTQPKSVLEAVQEESVAISEERDTLKAAAFEAAESTFAPVAEELVCLRREKRALEQALQEARSKLLAQASAPDAFDLETHLGRIVSPPRT